MSKVDHTNLCTFLDDEFNLLQEAIQIQQNKKSITVLYDHIRIDSRISVLRDRFREILNEKIMKRQQPTSVEEYNKVMPLMKEFDLIMKESTKIAKAILALHEQKHIEYISHGDKAIIAAIKQAQTEHAPEHLIVKIGAGHLTSLGAFNFFLEQQRQAGTSVNIIDITDPALPVTLQPFTALG